MRLGRSGDDAIRSRFQRALLPCSIVAALVLGKSSIGRRDVRA